MFTFVGGPCVIEGREHTLKMCESIKRITDELGIPFVFKASFDKANRTSIKSFRGPGIDEGLKILNEVKGRYDVEILTDIHEPWQADVVSKVADYIQIPAFLCRQTDLIVAASKTGKIVNIKKGQFLSGKQMRPLIDKAYSTGNHSVILCERGTMFGYNQLVVDIKNIVDMKKLDVPVMFDATHSVQCRDNDADCSGGNPEYIIPYIKAVMSVGVDYLFMEVHDSPEEALSDGTNMLNLKDLKATLLIAKGIYMASKEVSCVE